MDRQVFCDLLFRKLDRRPASGAPDYPPSTYDRREGVRVVRRIRLHDPVRGRTRASREHGIESAERSEVGW